MTLQSALILIDSVLYNMTGLIIIILGVFISLRVTGFPDLTVDGSFTFGAVLYAVSAGLDLGVGIALFAATAGGAAAGWMTWAVNQKLGVGKIMSGVLVMIILVLAAPYFSGGSTMTLLNTSSFFNSLEQRDIALSAVILGSQSYRLHILFVLFWTGAALVIMFAVRSGLATRLGLRLRYLGAAANPTLLNLPSRPLFVCAGLTIGNALVAIGGAVEAERRGGFTVNMGTGIILVAIAILLLGESILKAIRKREFLTVSEYLLAAVTGTFVYSIGVQAILLSGFGFIDLRLITALFLLCLLALAGRYHSNASKLF